MAPRQRYELELVRFRKANIKRLIHISRNAKSKRICNKANRSIMEMTARAMAAAFLYIKPNNQAALP